MARTLELSNPPLHGGDVIALQTALKAAKFYTGPVDAPVTNEKGQLVGWDGPGYSSIVAHSCEKAKFALGYPKSGIHPKHETAGPTLVAYLQGHKSLPVAYRVRRHERLNLPTAEQAKRAKVVGYWDGFLLVKKDDIHYSERRPIDGINDLQRLPSWQDCSGTVTKACKYGDLADPNGLYYSGEGWTGTLLAHCRRITADQVQPADLVVFVRPSEPGGHHVAQILSRQGDDFWIGSHGQESDPQRILLSQEAANQAAMGATEIHYLAVSM